MTIWDSNPEACGAAHEALSVMDLSMLMSSILRTPRKLRRQQDEWFARACIDIMVHSAGGSGPEGTVSGYEPNAWRNFIDLNLNATFYAL